MVMSTVYKSIDVGQVTVVRRCSHGSHIFLVGRGSRAMVTISEIASTSGFKGSKYHKYSDMPADTRTAIDLSEGKKRSSVISTSVDCYVSGTYVNNKGMSVDIRQRYTVFVSYNIKTQVMALRSTRDQIMRDFTNRFTDFKITDVFVPETSFVTPIKEGPEDVAYYEGSELFKRMSKIDVAEYRAQTERAIYESRLKKIKGGNKYNI